MIYWQDNLEQQIPQECMVVTCSRDRDTLIKGVWECLARVSTSDYWGRRGQGQKPRA